MIKLAIICPSNLPVPSTRGGAIETLLTNFIQQNELSKKLQITVFSFYEKEAAKISKDYKFTRIIYTNMSLNYRFFNFFTRVFKKTILKNKYYVDFYMIKSAHFIKKNRYDLVLIEGEPKQIIYLKKKTKLPIILHLHTDILNSKTINGKWMFESTNKILAVSEFIKKRIMTIENDKNHIEVVHNCVDNTKFDLHRKTEFKNYLKQKYNIANEMKIIIFCGRIDRQKGIYELINAHNRTEHNSILFVIGSTWFSTDNESDFLIELKRIAKKTIFTGYVPHNELFKYYSSADLACFPSKYNEAAGLVILEAMSMGVPVITTNIGGIPEYANGSYLIDETMDLENGIFEGINKILSDDKISKIIVDEQLVAVRNRTIKNYYEKIYEDIYKELNK